ncbi:MAG: hypothetical protein ABN483_22315, partial [Pantoea agglomerans]
HRSGFMSGINKLACNPVCSHNGKTNHVISPAAVKRQSTISPTLCNGAGRAGIDPAIRIPIICGSDDVYVPTRERR